VKLQVSNFWAKGNNFPKV